VFVRQGTSTCRWRSDDLPRPLKPHVDIARREERDRLGEMILDVRSHWLVDQLWTARSRTSTTKALPSPRVIPTARQPPLDKLTAWDVLTTPSTGTPSLAEEPAKRTVDNCQRMEFDPTEILARSLGYEVWVGGATQCSQTHPHPSPRSSHMPVSRRPGTRR
jgi:hypothetical protein